MNRSDGIEIEYSVKVRIPQGVLGGTGISGIQNLMGAIAGNNSAMPQLPPDFQHHQLMFPPAQEPTYQLDEYLPQPTDKFPQAKPLVRAIAIGMLLSASILGFIFRADLRLATAPDTASLNWSAPDPVSGARTLLEPKAEKASQKVEASSDAQIPKDKNAAAGENPPWDDKLLTPALTGN